jgi:hypothetical protein
MIVIQDHPPSSHVELNVLLLHVMTLIIQGHPRRLGMVTKALQELDPLRYKVVTTAQELLSLSNNDFPNLLMTVMIATQESSLPNHFPNLTVFPSITVTGIQEVLSLPKEFLNQTVFPSRVKKWCHHRLFRVPKALLGLLIDQPRLYPIPRMVVIIKGLGLPPLFDSSVTTPRLCLPDPNLRPSNPHSIRLLPFSSLLERTTILNRTSTKKTHRRTRQQQQQIVQPSQVRQVEFLDMSNIKSSMPLSKRLLLTRSTRHHVRRMMNRRPKQLALVVRHIIAKKSSPYALNTVGHCHYLHHSMMP